MEIIKEDEVQIYKLVNRRWKALPTSGDDISIKDPKLKQGYIGDLQAKTYLELEEIFQRNEKLLKNKFLLSKLKDKGKRLQSQQNELAAALEKAREREKCVKDVPHQNDVHGFEWTGTLTNNEENFKEENNPPDFENETLDPLKLMANHSSVVEPLESRIARMNEDEDPASVIAKELEQLDLKDSAHVEEVATFGAKREQMFQEKYQLNGPAKISFKPFRPASNPRPVPGIFVKPKPMALKPVKCISQEESKKLEKEFLDKEKKREVKHLIEGLDRLKVGPHIREVPPSAFGKYRDTNVMKHILDSDEEDVDEDEAYEYHNYGIHDDDDEEDA